MPYCTRDDLIERLSAVGLRYVVDDDNDGSATSGEQNATLDAGIATANAEIDAALAPHGLALLEQPNAWLTQRAIDIAVERVVVRKGQFAPASFADAAKRSRAWLDEVRKGTRRVPGLAYTKTTDRAQGDPRVINP